MIRMGIVSTLSRHIDLAVRLARVVLANYFRSD